MPASQPTIAMLQSSSLASVVQGELERMILSGELGPGERLTEVALASRLGISRGPLREAFRMLDEAGLVRTEKNRGVFVRSIPVGEAIEILDLRAAMDEWIGRRVAEVITPEALRGLDELVDAMQQAVADEDPPRYQRLDNDFHDRLVALTGNGKLAAIHRRLVKELSLFRRVDRDDAQRLPASADEHRQIVQAIGRHDAHAAGQAMLAHALASKARTIRNLAHRAPPDRAASHAR